MPSQNAGTVGTENQRQRALASAMSLRMNLNPIVVCSLVAIIICSALAYFVCSLVADFCCGL
jgi:hypothetical protein